MINMLVDIAMTYPENQIFSSRESWQAKKMVGHFILLL